MSKTAPQQRCRFFLYSFLTHPLFTLVQYVAMPLQHFFQKRVKVTPSGPYIIYITLPFPTRLPPYFDVRLTIVKRYSNVKRTLY